MVTVLWTGSDRFGYAVSTSLHGLQPNFTDALKICLGRFLSPFRSARLIGSGGNSPSSRFSWRKVWTGVECNFSSAQLHDRYVDGKLPISRVWMCNFTRIRRKTKKLWLSIIPARRMCDQAGLGQPQKVWTPTFLGRTSTSRMLWESSRYLKLKYAFSAALAKNNKLQLFQVFSWKLRKILLDWAFIMRLYRDRRFFFSAATRALHHWKALD